MSKLSEHWKQGAGQAWESLAEGWRELGARASGALTRFWSVTEAPDARPAAGAEQPRPVAAHDERWPPPARWTFMAVDIYAGAEQLQVRIEAPGMRREDFRIEMASTQVLSVSGHKRLDEHFDHGSYRLVQCAYGSFRRDIHLPAAVDVSRAQARYEHGVLRIALPRQETPSRQVEVRG